MGVGVGGGSVTFGAVTGIWVTGESVTCGAIVTTAVGGARLLAVVIANVATELVLPPATRSELSFGFRRRTVIVTTRTRPTS